jgi:amino acid adenylation domain-containing protein/non-ribosomal peptide synthase protein (TIGR01720 family)
MLRQGNTSEKSLVGNLRIGERDYWLNRLAGDWPRSLFPRDWHAEGEENRGDEGQLETISFTLDSEIFERLMKLSNRVDHTLHVILSAGVVELLSRYTGNRDIVIGCPIYRQEAEGEFINTALALRVVLREQRTFKTLLLQMRQTVVEAVEHRDYPIDILVEKLNRPAVKDGFPLFDVAVLLENIHADRYLAPLPLNVIFSFSRSDGAVTGSLAYNPRYYEADTAKGIVRHFIHLLEGALQDPDRPLAALETMPEPEKERILREFNDTRFDFPRQQTVSQLFEERADWAPRRPALSAPLDLTDVYGALKAAEQDGRTWEVLGRCCFQRSPYTVERDLPPGPGGGRPWKLLKSHRHHCFLVCANVKKLLELFDGRLDVKAVFSLVKPSAAAFRMMVVPPADMLEITWNFDNPMETFSSGRAEDFVRLVKILYRCHLIELSGLADKEEADAEAVAPDFDTADPDGVVLPLSRYLWGPAETLPGAQLVLLGDSPGLPSVGLLYLAAYLRRKGIKALCLWDDAADYPSLKETIEGVLDQLRPAWVGVSLKWFMYIARVRDICRLVKNYAQERSLDIKVVVGGDTASYYWRQIIEFEEVDCVIRGEGEEPLRQLLQDGSAEGVANCVYKKGGRVVENPFTYVRDNQVSEEIYLSHLDDILIGPLPLLLGAFFIHTHRGCQMNCFYCGGARQAQVETSGRRGVWNRPVPEVQKDVAAVLQRTTTLQFDLNMAEKEMANYCRQVWSGIEPHSHFCILGSIVLPPPELVVLASRTFRYVYIDIDVCTLSQRHRRQLAAEGLVKPQPGDDDILAFLDHAQGCGNVEVRLNVITGLPYLTTDDLEAGQRFLDRLLESYSCLGELHWARLHAQPGAPLADRAGDYGMRSFAVSFDDFLHHSEENLKSFVQPSGSPGLEYLHYPYIYYQDDRLNAKVTGDYSDNNIKMARYLENRRTDLLVNETLSYGEVERQANRLARALQADGVGPGDLVGLMMTNCPQAVVAILGILKAGAAYLPLDPDYPERRIRRMIEDAAPGVVVSSRRYIKILNRLQWECRGFHTYICLDSHHVHGEREEGSELADPRLWDSVGERGVDDITTSGWFSSYTGAPFSAREMAEYGDNILQKLAPLLHRDMKVLEIGCASGFTMYRLAPLVKLYVGIDFSQSVIDRNRRRIEEEGLTNIRLICLDAGRIDEIEEQDFDMVILNSVIQSFNGHNELRQVMAGAAAKLGPQGYIFVGDVMDHDKREALIRETAEFARAHRDEGYKTKTDWSIELFVSRHFFEDLRVDIPQIRQVTFSDKIHTVENELTRFRYDCLLEVDNTVKATKRRETKHRYQQDLTTLESYPGKRLSPAADHRCPAYVIYTSGTSGTPRGVVVRQDSLVNYVHWFSRAARLSEGDRAALTSSLVFDLGYTALYPALLKGLGLHVLGREVYLFPRRLLDYIKQQGITYVKMTPSLWTTLVNSPHFSRERCETLRLVVLGGEEIDPADVGRVHRVCAHLEVMNHYGPTEATIGAVAQYIDFDRWDAFNRRPTIGRPIDNTAVLILDRELRLLPVGVPGELCLAGAGLSSGYLNRPELTADKFINLAAKGREDTRSPSYQPLNPKSQILTPKSYPLNPKSQPLYRTGDLCRFLADGTVEFLGRLDQQVKIRGYRIELAEIENRLARHPQVREAAVVDRQDDGGEKYICAYVVPAVPLRLKGEEAEPRPGKDGVPRSLEEISQKAALTAPPADYQPFRETGRQQTIAGGFRSRAEQLPGQPVLRQGEEVLTYRELDRWSRRLAAVIVEKYDDRFRLSRREKIRYDRQMRLADWGAGSQERLKAATVFVAGAGGGASPTLTQLALAGFGTIVVCDDDQVTLSNLNRQFLHDESRLGMNKALSAQKTLRQLNPHLKVVAVSERLTRENVHELVGTADLIFDMLDDVTGKFILSQYAVARRIPHVVAAMTDLNAYAAIFHSPASPCFHCLFDREKFSALARLEEAVSDYRKNPLPVVASSLFASTGFVVTEAIKIVLGLGPPAYNRFFLFNHRQPEDIVDTDGYRMMTYPFSRHFKTLSKAQGFDWERGWRGRFLEEIAIEKDPHCPLCGQGAGAAGHTFPPPVEVSRDPQDEGGGETTEERQAIALLLSRLPDLTAAVAAAHRAAKTVVPLEPTASAPWLMKVLEDSEARLILTDRGSLSLAAKVRDGVNRRIPLVNIDDIDRAGPEGEDGWQDAASDPQQAAYILYPPDPGDSRESRQSGRQIFQVVESQQAVMRFARAYAYNLEQSDGKGPAFALNRNPLNRLVDIYTALLTGRPLSIEKQDRPGSVEAFFAGLQEYLLTDLPGYMIPGRFVPLEQMPLTANNKVDRRALPEPAARTAGHAYAAPENRVETELARVCGDVLGRERLGMEDNFFEMGLDSIKAIQVSARMLEQGFKVELRDIFSNPTIRRLGRCISAVERIVDQGPVEGDVPLTPIQQWFFDTHTVDPHHFNLSVMLHFPGAVEEAAVRAVFSTIRQHHDALRLVFRRQDGDIVQTNRGADQPLWVEVCDLRRSEDQKAALAALEKRAHTLQAGIDLESGPLLKLGLFHLDDGSRLLIVIHHLVVDGVSWRILFEDIDSLFRQYRRGEPLNLPPKSDSFKLWAESLCRHADSEPFLREKAFWRQQESVTVPPISRSGEVEESRAADSRRISVSLNEEETRQLLTVVNSAFGTEINDILIAALGLALYRSHGQQQILIALEGHGREEILKQVNVGRTVGWFTCVYPLLLDFSAHHDLGRLIKGVKEGIRRVPNRGIGYGILRYLTAPENREDIEFSLQPQILFNYFGEFDTPLRHLSFGLARESAGDARSSRTRRPYDLEVSGIVGAKKLALTIEYNSRQHKPADIQGLLDAFAAQLRRLIAFCAGRGEREMTPSDLTFKELPLETVEALNRTYGLADVYPLSPMQQGLLYQYLVDGNRQNYCVGKIFRIRGEFDPQLFRRSFDKLIERYDILRTIFKTDMAELPLQVVKRRGEMGFEYRDIAVADDEERERILSRHREELKREGFDPLADEPLMRVSLFRLSAGEFEVIWQFHHILMDGWCLIILFQEILQIYHQLGQRQNVRLEPVIPYKRYIEWLMDQDRQAAADFWKHYLEGYDKPVSLPGQKESPRREEKRERLISFQIPHEAVGALQKIANRQQATLYTIIQAVWGLLLSRYSGSRDVLFGQVVSGRPESIAGIERMVGLFINTVPKRIKLVDTGSFEDLVGQVARDELDAAAFHYYPLGDILGQGPLRTELFDHIIVFENYAQLMNIDREVSLIDFRVNILEEYDPNQYGLSAFFIYQQDLWCKIRFDEQVYEESRLREIGDRFQDIVRQVLKDPRQSVETIVEGVLTQELRFPDLSPMAGRRG